VVTISQLPVELFFIIRDHLCQEVVGHNPYFICWFDAICHNDSHRSWRNFLSTSSVKTWELVRRTTMVWTLNYIQSLKYLNDGNFREYLLNHMLRPSEQLQLRQDRNETVFKTSLWCLCGLQ
jgi:hypothetical protein